MKKILFILLLALALPCVKSTAQKIALGERVPELKVSAWLENRKPAAAPLTYVEFFQSSNKASMNSVARLKEISNKFGTKLRVVILAQEKEEKISPLLSEYLSQTISVGFDAEGRIFTAFGVSYLPFGVLLDAKNRALWMGNTLQLTPELIEKSAQ